MINHYKIYQLILKIRIRNSDDCHQRIICFSEVVETNVKRDESADDGVDDVARERRGLLTLQLRKHHSEDEIGEDQELEDHQRQQQQQQQQPNELENNSRISWDGKVGRSLER